MSEAERQGIIVVAAEKTCRDALAEARQNETQSQPVVADFMGIVLNADAYCGCTTRLVRIGLENGKADSTDRAAVAGLLKSAGEQCGRDAFVDHFAEYCNTLFTHFYGDGVLSGPFAGGIGRFCDCSRNELNQLRPDALGDAVERSKESLNAYRDSGELVDKRDGSLASVMAGCGIVDLKRRLTESMR
ncbi:MAG: hypothetical protein KA144_06380 [Xanthomonadaceae bacterium]|nr:hypothetical protein [Xanthomonadaceae bacterium]